MYAGEPMSQVVVVVIVEVGTVDIIIIPVEGRKRIVYVLVVVWPDILRRSRDVMLVLNNLGLLHVDRLSRSVPGRIILAE